MHAPCGLLLAQVTSKGALAAVLNDFMHVDRPIRPPMRPIDRLCRFGHMGFPPLICTTAIAVIPDWPESRPLSGVAPQHIRSPTSTHIGGRQHCNGLFQTPAAA